MSMASLAPRAPERRVPPLTHAAGSPATRPLRVAIMCRREIVARGMVAMLSEHPERISVMMLPSISSAVADLDVVVYDLALVRELGEDHLAGVIDAVKGQVVGLAYGASGMTVSNAASLGLAGCLTLDSTPAEVMAGIGRAAAGLPVDGQPTEELLSSRERLVLALIFEGLSNAEIADRLFISINTLKSHIRSAYRKMGVHSRAQAVAWCALHGVNGPGG